MSRAERAWVTGRRAVIVAALLVVALVPVLFSTYFTGAVGSRALYLGLAAASLTYLAGSGGMVSLAQTALYGVGGFVLARLIVSGGMDPLLAAVLAILAAMVVGLAFGAISSRSEGIYFLMITLAFAVITYFFFSQVPSFGSHEGINGVTTPGFIGDPVTSPAPIYYATLVCSVAVYLLLRAIGRTPFGLALQGVRDDPVRMRAMGYAVGLHRTVGFGLGALIAGLAGVLGTWHETRISPGTIDVGATIQLLTMAVIGGLYRLEGAWIGALVYTLLDTYTRGLTGRFETWIGAVFLLIVILSPNGITGLAGALEARARRALTGRSRAPGEPPPAPEPSLADLSPADPAARPPGVVSATVAPPAAGGPGTVQA